MTLLSRRVDRVGVVLDRLPRPAAGSDRLPDEVADLVLDGMRLCEERDQAAGDHERWGDLTRETYYIAGRVALELDRLAGRAVPQWKVDALEDRQQVDVPVVERIQERAAPEPAPEIPLAILADVERRRAEREGLVAVSPMRHTFGAPSQEHRRWSEWLRHGRRL